MKTYLVTGGAGFIGSNYIHYMFRKYGSDIYIINVDALTYAGNPENLKDIEKRENYKFIHADITDKEAIEKNFDDNDIDRVVHFAAESHVDRSIRNPEVFVKTNVLGTAVMLNCAKKAWELPDGTFKADKKFLHVSTDKYTGIINVCSGNPVSLADRVEQFIKERNLNIKLSYGAFPDRPYDSKIVYGDNSIIREIIK